MQCIKGFSNSKRPNAVLETAQVRPAESGEVEERRDFEFFIGEGTFDGGGVAAVVVVVVPMVPTVSVFVMSMMVRCLPIRLLGVGAGGRRVRAVLRMSAMFSMLSVFSTFTMFTMLASLLATLFVQFRLDKDHL